VRSNCVEQALREYRDRLRAGREPYLLIRESRSDPHWIPHFLIGEMDPRTGQVAVESFKPLRPEDVPCWRVLERRRFEGIWVPGDTHVHVSPGQRPLW
jgi:hypothetical protein